MTDTMMTAELRALAANWEPTPPPLPLPPMVAHVMAAQLPPDHLEVMTEQLLNLAAVAWLQGRVEDARAMLLITWPAFRYADFAKHIRTDRRLVSRYNKAWAMLLDYDAGNVSPTAFAATETMTETTHGR